jgi:tetratricopeptide (TPR) repeat protein
MNVLKVSILLVAALTLGGCRQEPVDTQELLTAHHLGLTDLRRGQLPQAEEQFKKVIQLAPRDPLGYANLGLTYLRGGRYEEAEEQLRRARRLNPENPEVGLIVAKLYSLTGREREARETLEGLRRDPKVLYALAELDARDTSSAGLQRYESRLREVLAAAPGNLAVRLKLADVLARRGAADSAARHLEDVRRLRPEPPREARPQLDSAIRRLRAVDLAAARPSLERFLRLMELTSPYQASLEEVKWLEGPIVGRPVLAFNPQSLIQTRGIIPVGRPVEVKFVDVTSDAGFPPSRGAATALALGDYDNDGTDDVFVSTGNPLRSALYRVQGGYVVDVTEKAGLAAGLPSGAVFATFADFDNDGWLDLFAIGADGRGSLLRNSGSGTFENVAARARLTDVRGATKARFFDADHDGDIDLLVLGDTTRLWRNNLDGTFTDVSAAAGLASVGASRDAAFGDLDDDGRVDLVVLRGDGRGAYFRNTGFQSFRDVTAQSPPTNGAAAVAVADFDNDGRVEVHVARRVSDLAILDLDNDGWTDVVSAGAGGELLRTSAGGFEPSRVLGAPLRSATLVAPSDVDGDGDQDLVLADSSSGIRLMRNDGGNARMSMQVQLMGLRSGSGKNNTFGVGSRIEVRAGEIYQTRVVTSRVTHFGLGPHLKADVVRVQWTNGVPELIYFPGTDQDILELETLKGSCAFLYTWDGTQFRFVTDVMWRSALGMPLGIMGGGGRAYAPAGASQEYLRIPGDALQPRDGRYVLQFTEELWETAYLDEIRLLAVDHPDTVEVFVDERFVPPGPVQLRIFQSAGRRPPVTAIDERGRDVLPALREKDDVYVSDFTPTRYQGVVESHDLILDLGTFDERNSPHLILRGWIYPSDASINVALSQQSALRVSLPSLEVRNARGQWEVAIPSLGFPSGKDKAIVVDLTGRFPTRDHRVRIRTNMAIHWDQAIVATDAATTVRTTELRPTSADLHFRGFSRMYRKGGRFGPHWFAYHDVRTDSPWRPIEGAFTRFGDVRPLLERADDRYVIMAPGDEATVAFDASTVRAPAPGWKRTFLLYTDGWIKDSDLNTAFGNSVEPLPFHANRSYPYEAGETYPRDSALAAYRREYNTRRVEPPRPLSRTLRSR